MVHTCILVLVHTQPRLDKLFYPKYDLANPIHGNVFNGLRETNWKQSHVEALKPELSCDTLGGAVLNPDLEACPQGAPASGSGWPSSDSDRRLGPRVPT